MLSELAGAGLILGATTYTGWQVAGSYARRPDQLRDLQTALAVLQTEVEYGATPLPQALLAAAGAGESARSIFAGAAERLAAGRGMTAGDALRAALAAVAEETALAREDVEVLLALAQVLGASGRTDQMRHLALARERLSGAEVRARDERARYERLARYLGVLSGAALVFILV